MSAPYVYTPQVAYRNSPYLSPFYGQQNSPFIPELSLNNSPFIQPNSLPPSPNPQNPVQGPTYPQFVPFPPSADESQYSQGPPWPRERRVSWNEGPARPPTQNTPWLRPRPQRQRTRSDNGYNFQPPADPNWSNPNPSPYNPFPQYPTAPPQFFLHPFLNGESPRADFVFDLSAPQFAPLRYVGSNQTLPITPEELAQVATHPPLYRLKIICDLIPNWPIEINYNQYAGGNTYSPVPPPLTLGDILSAIWGFLQMSITQTSWASLTPQQEHMVGVAYTKRCRAMPSAELALRNKGVKKVDFLLGKKWFKGLVPIGDNLETLRLHVI
ncbi:hypothetical protein M413DRAFT_438369 [Hebeloma cylindrosporum]|uniref:DUF6699 domain-containing protein n=1 Tax=Hebeloma cylindrosporum TaxID=76867 RepID=A0A0C3CYH2_HEBCY|nr:hypothetical protein M413DRAFT_438369 [Hebeloma cylindrosporum h7]